MISSTNSSFLSPTAQTTIMNVVRACKNPAAEVTLAALSIPLHMSVDHPAQFYYTTECVDIGRKLIAKTELLEEDPVEAEAIDKLLYHAILYLIGHGLLSETKRTLLLPLLSSPVIMKHICKQSWFVNLKRKITGKNISISAKDVAKFALKMGKEQLEQYLNANLVTPLKKIIYENKLDLLRNLKDSCAAALNEKIEIIEGLRDELLKATHDIPEVLKNRIQDHHLERSIKRAGSVQQDVASLMKKPEISIFKKEKTDSLSPLLKTYKAWSLAAYAHPALLPYLFMSSSPDLTELSLRTGGAIVSAMSGRILFPLLGVELIQAVVPQKIRRSFTYLPLETSLHGAGTRLSGALDYAKKDVCAHLKQRGYQRETINTISKATAQFFAGAAFMLLCSENHPLANAFAATSFTEYLAMVADYQGLAKEKSMVCENSFLDRFPLQVVTGLALTALDIKKVPRPFTTLICSVLSSPVIVDSIVDTDFYQNRVLVALKGTVIPKYHVIRKVLIANSALSFVRGGGDLIKTSTLIKYLYTPLAVATVAGTVLVAKTRVAKYAATKVKNTAMLGFKIYSRDCIYRLLSPIFGLVEANIISNLATKPKTMAVMGGMAAGTVTGYITQDPFYAAAATEVVEAALQQPFVVTRVNSTASKCKSFFASIFRSIGQLLENEAAIIRESVD